ncbi:hypothetical protein [Tsukamurella tyrosinosolvens]|uniref:hypothetical protein n=1 Tax=Tsukamurella tyrosinosolvens TaxID=57704 RepID=UPI0034632F30
MIVTIEQKTTLLPALPGMVSGIVGISQDHRGHTITSVQCATCKRVATDIMILAVGWATFSGDGDRNAYNYPGGARFPYRRCADCQKAGKHPEEWAS